ncbi:MAG: MATE family efflux transporter [Pseudomonadota bacterium]
MTSQAEAEGPRHATEENPTVWSVVSLALPVVLSNAAIPLQSAIDMAIIGNTGDTTLLAAMALGAAAVILVFSSFNFLQTGIGGTTAQALGAGNHERVANTMFRGLIIAATVAACLILLRPVLVWAGLALFEGSAEAEAAAAIYIGIRLLGAPFELSNYALMGWFVGQGKTRRLFELQLLVSITNIAMTLLLVLVLDMGIQGVAIGTVIGHATAFAYAVFRVRQRLRVLLPAGWRPDRRRLLKGDEIGALLRLNRDIFLRNVMITLSFAWVTRLGSLQGDAVLAANGVLLEFFFVTAHALDGFAIAAESLVGRAIGARSATRLRQAVRVCAIASVALALVLSLILSFLAHDIVALFTDVAEVRALAGSYVYWAACIPLAGVAAFVLDGVYFGAADGRTLRNTTLLSAALFLPGGWLAMEVFGNHGLWASLWGFLLIRAVALGLDYPALVTRATASTSAPTASPKEA